MYKNRVKNDRKIFEIPAILLSSQLQQGNPEQENSRYNFEFFGSGFPHSQEKRMGISKVFLSFFTLPFYIRTLTGGCQA